jgi:hypothetical protein
LNYQILLFQGFLYGWNVKENSLVAQLHIATHSLTTVACSALLSSSSMELSDVELSHLSYSDSILSSLLWLGDTEGNVYTVVEQKGFSKFILLFFIIFFFNGNKIVATRLK